MAKGDFRERKEVKKAKKCGCKGVCKCKKEVK